MESESNKQTCKDVDAMDAEGKTWKQSFKKGEDSDSDAKPMKPSVKMVKKTGLVAKPSKSAEGKKVGAGDSEAKKPKLSGKAESDANKSKQTVKKVDAMDAQVKTWKQSVKIGEDRYSDSDTEPLKFSVKKREKSMLETKERNAGNSGSKKKDDGRKHGIGKNVAEKDQAKSLYGDDEMDTSPKSATKSAKGEGSSKETPANSSKRKRTTGKDKVSDTVKYDKSLVGLKIKVFWPLDNRYYEGVIDSFDSATKLHKVAYVDGEMEIMNLKMEKWEIVQEFSVRDEDQTTIGQSDKFLLKSSKRIPIEEENKTDEIYTACWKMFKDAVHTLPANEREKLKKSKNSELSQGLDHTIMQMFGYMMEAHERWDFLSCELKEKTKELLEVSDSINRAQQNLERLQKKENDSSKKVYELEKELASCKAVTEQRTRERDYFDKVVKLKEEEIKWLMRKCMDAEKKAEEKVAEVEEKASEKIKTLEEKHKALVAELSRIKLEKTLAEGGSC